MNLSPLNFKYTLDVMHCFGVVAAASFGAQAFLTLSTSINAFLITTRRSSKCITSSNFSRTDDAQTPSLLVRPHLERKKR